MMINGDKSKLRCPLIICTIIGLSPSINVPTHRAIINNWIILFHNKTEENFDLVINVLLLLLHLFSVKSFFTI